LTLGQLKAGQGPSTEKHLALSDEDFQAALGCNKDEFKALPGWKKSNKLRAAGLF
jgi:hypothetical protein